MEKTSFDNIQKYVEGLELPSAPPRVEALSEPPAPFDPSKAQAVVVGSSLTSFAQGVPLQIRRSVSSSFLLAQLVANRRVPDDQQVKDWYDAYFDVLTNLGWAIQTRDFAAYEASASGVKAHEAILQVAATLLGPAATALSLVTSALNALKSMEDSPWITLFNRESQHARTGRFQVSLTQDEGGGQMGLSLMAFTLTAETEITQILFFKIRSSRAALEHLSGQVSLDASLLANVQAAVDEKVRAFQSDYVRTLPDLTPDADVSALRPKASARSKDKERAPRNERRV